MRLKEIKPGMIIHCKDNREYEQLQTEAIRLGYGELPLPFTDKHLFHVNDIGGITWSFVSNDYKYIEFSDLIIPDLTAEELLQVINDICNTYSNCSFDCKKECPLCHGYCKEWMAKHPKETVEICAQWKSEHEKKEPEIETEWIWQGRIFVINEDGCYCQINDGTGFYNTGCEYRESAEEYMADELKEYCKTHDGEFIAVVEHVCRVKEKK